MRRALLSLAVILLAAPSSADETPLVGSATAGNLADTLSCGADKVIVGFEIKYGQVGIGRLRASCRRVSSDGKWNGGASFTPWSRVDSDAESTTTRSTSCNQNQAVSSFRARVQGAYIHALRIGCRPLSGTGGVSTTGSPNWNLWVGLTKGSESDAVDCTSGLAGMQVRTRSRTNLHRFSLVCDQATVTQPATRSHSITGYDIGRFFTLAGQKGYRSRCTVLRDSAVGSSCSVRNSNGRVSMVLDYPLTTGPIQPTGKVRAVFLGDGDLLREGWSLQSFEVDLSQAVCDTSLAQPIIPNSLEVIMNITCETPDTVPVRRIVLRGPDGSTWRDAFPD